MLAKVFTGLSIGGAVAGCIGTVGSTLCTKHKQNVEFENRMEKMQEEFESRFNEDRWNDSITTEGDPQ